MRIEDHPVLGTFEKGKKIQFTFDGQSMEGYEGEPIAIALRSNGVPSDVAPTASWLSTANPISEHVSNP